MHTHTHLLCQLVLVGAQFVLFAQRLLVVAVEHGVLLLHVHQTTLQLHLTVVLLLQLALHI